MAPTVVVTGASGFAGSHLLDLLANDREIDLVAWRRPRSHRAAERAAWRAPLDRRLAWEEIDILNRSTVRTALARTRPDVVYHCAGAAHVGQSWQTTEPTLAINVRGTHNVIESLRETDNLGARVLIPSSAMVYAAANEPLTENHPIRPGSPYGVSKLAQELVGTGNIGGPVVLVARAFNHIGPRQDSSFAASAFARRIAAIEAGRAAPELQVGNLEARRDLTDVRDTVRAYRRIAERGVGGRPYNVCSGRAVAIRDVVDMLRARAKVPIRVVIDPARYRPNDQALVVGSPDRLKKELGWTAEIPLEQTLDDLLAYWRTAC